MKALLFMILQFLDVAPLEPGMVFEDVVEEASVPYTLVFVLIGVVLLIVIGAVIAIGITKKKQ